MISSEDVIMEKENFAFTKILFEAKVKWLFRQKKKNSIYFVNTVLNFIFFMVNTELGKPPHI